MTGSKGVAVPIVLVLTVALIVACFPATSRGVEPAPEGSPSVDESSSPPEQPSPQYGAPPTAPKEDVSLGAGGPPTAEVNPGAQYAPTGAHYAPDNPASSDCGTYEDPCSSDALSDGAEPAAEDAQSTDQALGEAHENGAVILEEAQTAEPANISPLGESVAVFSQYGAPALPVADVHNPVVGKAADTAQETSAPEEALPVQNEARTEEAEPGRSPKATSDGTRGSHPGAKTEIPAEARKTPEQAVEEQRAANRLSAVPISATGGSLLFALGVGALLYRRFGR